MANLIHRPEWLIAEKHATPENAFLNRRQLIKTAAFGAIGAGLSSKIALADNHSAADKTKDLYPAEKNTSFTLDRDLTPEDVNLSYNNFYEFGSHKQIARAAGALKTDPWDVTIDGLVEEEMTVPFDQLIRKVAMEERLYRHRCVEAWSMTVPWTGFTVASLLNLVRPLSSAKYVRFETFLDPGMASGQRQSWYPWPYIEGMTIEEAQNDLSFMVTGAYGKPLANQMGAPLRLALPWKYGFKSIKSISKITLTDERPVSFWEEVAAKEYGFWANVNPEVPHKRWSQAQERILHTGETVPTLKYNGYEEQVAHLYKDVPENQLFY